MNDQPQGYGEPHILFAQALVQLARDHGVHNFDGKFRLGWNDEGRPGWSGDNVSVSWSEGRHGDNSNIVLRCEQTAVVPEIAPNTHMVPPMIYASEGNFYEVTTRKGKGNAFYERWRGRVMDFPQSREEAIGQMNEDTRSWVLKRYP